MEFIIWWAVYSAGISLTRYIDFKILGKDSYYVRASNDAKALGALFNLVVFFVIYYLIIR